MKRNKGTILIIIMAIIILLIPNLPYKVPRKIKNTSLTELELTYSEVDNKFKVENGQEEIVKFATEKECKSYVTDYIYLMNGIEDHIYHASVFGEDNIRVYGEITYLLLEDGVFHFKVDSWYPANKFLPIKYTKIWTDKYFESYIKLMFLFAIWLWIRNLKRNKEKRSLRN